MISNGIWDILFLTDILNQEKKLKLLLHHSWFLLDWIKLHIKILQKYSNSDQCVVQNLIWSGVYLKISFKNDIIQKLPTLVVLTETRTKVYVPIMAVIISNYYYSLKETFNHLNSIKPKIYYGSNISDFCVAILENYERLESTDRFKLYHLG